MKSDIQRLETSGIQVELSWSPSHSNIKGNEYADQMAKEAAEEAKEKMDLPPIVTMGDVTGIFFAILGRGPRAFQIGKISAVNHYFGKFSKQTRTAFLVSLKTKLAITHTIAIKLKENRMQFE